MGLTVTGDNFVITLPKFMADDIAHALVHCIKYHGEAIQSGDDIPGSLKAITLLEELLVSLESTVPDVDVTF